METIKVDILNPKAGKLIEDLEALDLVAIREDPSHNFADVLARLRARSGSAPSPEDIAGEVDIARSEREARGFLQGIQTTEIKRDSDRL